MVAGFFMQGTKMADYPNLVVAIGASAGGFKEILTIVKRLPGEFQGSIVIATHRTPDSSNRLADILRSQSDIEVCQPIDNDSLDCATLYVGAGDQKVEVEDGGKFGVQVDVSSFARINRIDDLFKSVAETAGANSVGVVLSGMLADGVEGLRAIRAAGGRCLVQDPEDADCQSMPKRALAAVDADFVGDSKAIADKLIAYSSGRSCQ